MLTKSATEYKMHKTGLMYHRLGQGGVYYAACLTIGVECLFVFQQLVDEHDPANNTKI